MLAADEIMVPYDGRSHETTHIPGKPHPDGVKVWAVAQSNFLIVWNFHTPGEGKGPVDTQTPAELGGSKRGGKGGNKTQAVVTKMMDRLPQPTDSKPLYHLWLDNLFTSTKFLEYMRNAKQIGISGTTRTNAGILDPILDMNKKDKGKSGSADTLPWGTLISLSTASNLVAQVGWKDSSFAIMMSTVLDGTEHVESLRKRPKQGKKKEQEKHKPFFGQPRALLAIPKIFDLYNWNMGPVDGFDHLTANNAGLRPVVRGCSQALEHWILRGVLANTYVVAQVWRRENDMTPLRSQKDWRRDIIAGLLKKASLVAVDTPVHPNWTISGRKRRLPDDEECSDQQHVAVKMKQNNCAFCAGKRKGDRPLKRAPLGTLSPNRVRERHVTSFGCKHEDCRVSLCRISRGQSKRRCFERWHIE